MAERGVEVFADEAMRPGSDSAPSDSGPDTTTRSVPGWAGCAGATGIDPMGERALLVLQALGGRKRDSR